MKEYKIEIWGDDALTATLNLSENEAATIKKVINALSPSGAFPPSISFTCLTDIEVEKKKAEMEERRRYEEEKAKEHMDDVKSIWKAAFEKAGMKI